MAQISIEIGEGYTLSIYQDEQTGQGECVPIYQDEYEGGLIGEPVFFKDAQELKDLLQSALDKDFAIWENQYYIELDNEYDNDNIEEDKA